MVRVVFDMSVSRILPSALSLKQRQKVLAIYRSMLRTIGQVPEEADRKYLRDWLRAEFKRNKDTTDQDAIRMMITQARNHLVELQKSLALAGNQRL
ncbi:LYR motif-containing protein 2 isoform X2 [Mastacembelus armatus]|uniref:LYR motif-containing protein 2 isoform X2 n=1 Tax=Mastacembelus armatus TaxID=205130 RepID=UPI000E460918|nr:LYR motif-containing protein 2 isoform X2 [Mastacembelus armatus]